MYIELLAKNGVENINDCMSWAFGDDWGGIRIDSSDNLWNKRHPKLETIEGSYTMEECFKIIAREYLNK